MNKTDRKYDILNLWKYQEFFSQQTLVKCSEKVFFLTKKPETADVVHLKKPYRWKEGVSLSELIENLKKASSKKLYDYIVVNIGAAKREFCTKKIAETMSLEYEEKVEQDNREIALATIALNAEGEYQKDSFDISPIFWAITHLKDNQNHIFSAFNRTKAEIEEKLVEIFDSIAKTETNEDQTEDEASKEMKECFIGKNAVSYENMRTIFDIVAEQLLGKNFVCDDNVRFECSIETTLFKNQSIMYKQSEEYAGLCMHFYLKDLEMISNGRIEEKKISDYINALVDGKERSYSDVYPIYQRYTDNYYDLMSRLLAPDKISLGKWPSKFNLSVFQQLAVNIAVSDDYENVFSVNGPPGTGKTTLLKDIAASNIVEKAKVLSQFDNPDDAFESHQLQTPVDRYNTKWYSFTKELQEANKYSMLVVCNNNSAAENISKDWPKLDELMKGLSGKGEALEEIKRMFTPSLTGDKETIHLFENGKIVKKEVDDLYFTDYARCLINNTRDVPKDNDMAAWGLVSAAIGNRTNIKKYCEKALIPYTYDFNLSKLGQSRKECYSAARRDFIKQYKKVAQLRANLDFIGMAQKEYDAQSDQLAAFKTEKSKYKSKLAETELSLRELRVRYPDIESDIKRSAQSANEANRKAEGCLRDIQELDGKIFEFDRQIEEIKKSIGFFQKLFKTKGYKEKHTAAKVYSDEKQKTMAQKTAIDKTCRGYLEACEAAGKDCDDYRCVKQKMTAFEKTIAELKTNIDNTENTISDYGKRILSLEENLRAENNGKTGEDRAIGFTSKYAELLLSPVKTEEKREAHKSVPWITAHFDREREKLFYLALKLTKEFVINARAVRQNINVYSAYMGTNNGEKIKFKQSEIDCFIVPVLQTLFLFTPIVSSTLASVARLFADAQQKDIVGYLFVDEAGQAVPYSVLGAMYRSRRTIAVGDPKQIYPVVTDDSKFINSLTSFDGIAQYNSDTVSVQNFIDALNPFGTDIDGERVGCPLIIHRRCASPMFDISNQISYGGTMINCTEVKGQPKTKWINCNGKERDKYNHFVPAQAQRVGKLLNELFESSHDVFIISPFKTVTDGLKQALRALIHNGRLKIKSDWVDNHIGTVHTFQGKEAETVIFVLGCDRSTKSGVKTFVGKNIVNVAASRAKRNFFVIGDAKTWESNEYIVKMKNTMDLYAIKLAKENENALNASITETIVQNLPNSFAETDDNEGNENKEAIINVSGYVDELKKIFSSVELTPDEMNHFNIEMEDMKDISATAKNNLIIGVKLYGLLNNVYYAYKQERGKAVSFDATCCSVLFCKFIENYIKDILLKKMKEVYPDFKVNGKPDAKLSYVDDKCITMGSIKVILKSEFRGEQTECFKQFITDLSDCTDMRNLCCHGKPFQWKRENSADGKGQDLLLVKIFGNKRKNEVGVFKRVKQIRDLL